MDFIMDLPRTKCDVDSIWVVVDRLNKRCHFVPTTKTVTAEGVARLFIDNIWKLHGMPSNIVSDRDRKFVSNFWQHVFKSIGTKLNMTVAHRAQGDGQTERMNRTLEEYLRCFVGPLQDDWDVHLANAEFAINSTVNSSTKLAPFEADQGYIPLNHFSSRRSNLHVYPRVVTVLSSTNVRQLFCYAVVKRSRKPRNECVTSTTGTGRSKSSTLETECT